MKRFGRVAFVVALIAALLGLVPSGVGVNLAAPAGAGSASACSGDPTPTKVVISNGDPYLAVAVGATQTTQWVTLCYSSGYEGESSAVGGVAHLLVGNSGVSTTPYVSAQLWCWPDSGVTGPTTSCYTGHSVWVSQLSLQPVDQPGNTDALYTFAWGFGMCHAAGCTTSGDTTNKTGLVVGTIGTSGAPGGGTGSSLQLTNTEVWFDGALVQSFGTPLAGAGVSNTGLPGTPGTEFTPGASGPCVAGQCTPAYELWLPAYGTSVTISSVAGTTTQPIGTGQICVIDSDTGNCT